MFRHQLVPIAVVKVQGPSWIRHLYNGNVCIAFRPHAQSYPHLPTLACGVRFGLYHKRACCVSPPYCHPLVADAEGVLIYGVVSRRCSVLCGIVKLVYRHVATKGTISRDNDASPIAPEVYLVGVSGIMRDVARCYQYAPPKQNVKNLTHYCFSYEMNNRNRRRGTTNVGQWNACRQS